MGTPVDTIRNLGPAMEAASPGRGSTTPGHRALGTDAAHARLLASGERPHFIAFCVIEMGLQGRPGTDCHGAEKAALRVRLDRLRAEHAGPSDGLERMLDRIGVVPRAPSGKAGNRD